MEARDVGGHCIDSFNFFFAYQNKNRPTFLSAFYFFFGQLIHCLEISGNKNNLRTY